MALVDFHTEGCESRLHHLCKGGYVAMHEIDLDGVERKICRDYAENIQMGGKPEKLKKVLHITVYRIDKLEEEK